jgi:hypothetical protein
VKGHLQAQLRTAVMTEPHGTILGRMREQPTTFLQVGRCLSTA